MLLAIPISSADSKLLNDTALLFKKFGPYAGFTCALFPRRDAENEARKFAEDIKPLFSSVEIHVLDFHASHNTQAAAKHFRETAQIIAEKYTGGPWYNYELDNTPVQAGWLTKLQREHHESGKAHMGAIVPTRGFILDHEGKRVPKMGDPHMVGTGVYHYALGKLSPLIAQIDICMAWAGPMEPYDIRMRYEIVPQAHNTVLIQHNWNTGNYRVEDGVITCDSLAHDAALSHAKPYDGHAIVIHGCKDGTLAKLVLADKIGKVAAPKVEVKTVSQPEEEEKSITGQDGKPPAVSFLAFRIKTELEKSTDRKTAKMLAESFSVTKEQIIAACEETGSGLKVAGPPKWVSLV